MQVRSRPIPISYLKLEPSESSLQRLTFPALPAVRQVLRGYLLQMLADHSCQSGIAVHGNLADLPDEIVVQ